MSNYRGLALVLGILICISLISAVTTPITIKTLPKHEVQVTAFDPAQATFTRLDGSIGKSDEYGDYNWNASISKDIFSLMIYIKQDGKNVIDNKKDNDDEYDAGIPVLIKLAPAWFEYIYAPNVTTEDSSLNETVTNLTANETLDNNSITEEDNFTANSLFSGLAISGDGTSFLKNKWTYYIAGGVILLIIIVILIIYFVKKRKNNNNNNSYTKTNNNSPEIKVKKLSEFHEEQAQQKQENAELSAAEDELKRAQAKLNSIKYKDRIEQIRKEIAEKEQDLIRLRSGIAENERQ